MLKRLWRIVSFYWNYPYPKVAQLSDKRAPQPIISSIGELKVYEWTAGFPGCVGCCQKTPLLSCPIQNTEVSCMTNGGAGTVARDQKVSKWCWFSNHFTDPIREPINEPLGHLTWKSLQQAHKHPQCSTCLTHTPPHDLFHDLLLYPEDSRCEFLQIAREHAQKASPTLWDWEKTHKFKHSALH